MATALTSFRRGTDRNSTPDAAELTELRREIAELRARQRSLELLLDGAGRGMARQPGPQHLAALSDELATITGDAEAARRDARCAFRLLVTLESLGVGRVAGGTMNICGKLAAVPLLAPPNDDVLEIGTLYGLFAAGLIRMLERAGRAPALTVVDPLIGSQLQSGTSMPADPSGTPVTEAAVRTNLSLAGPAGLAARIQRGYSTDPVVRAAVSDRQYGTVIVDGDHSQAGVAADLEWVEQLVAPGGVVVLDDFGDAKWPGVAAAFEDHRRAGSRLELLGRAANSGYLRAR